VLRGISRDGLPDVLAEDPALDAPAWLMARWTRAYGAEAARAFAAAHRTEAALDLTVRADPEAWAEKLGAEILPTGSLRLLAKGAVPALPGYEDGAWWVQDAAAALPARLLGDVAGLRVADLCAAPGGKTAQLAAVGAQVTAVDVSPQRLERLAANLQRLKLSAEIVAADARAFDAAPFDAVLLDAPCSATGTIRRHPDVAWLKRESDLGGLTALQAELLDAAARLVRPGGKLIYSVCSLEPEEGEGQIEALLARNASLRLDPIAPAEIGGVAGLITPAGTLRALPTHMPHAEARLAGLDGFFAARLVRT
jgi:16S rRNA (cytosine967-C5)-methyltransferase